MSDCEIMDPVYRGVELQDCQRCRITNNTIVDRRTLPTMRQAIRLTGHNQHILIAGKILGGATEALVEGQPETPQKEGNLLMGHE